MHYKKLNPVFTKQFYKYIDSADSITITCHYSPDDDAVSSILATYCLIHTLHPKKTVTINISGNVSQRFSGFSYFDKIITSDDIFDLITPGQLVIFLDGSQYSRFTNRSDELKGITFKSICIDHHLSPPENFDLLLQESTSSSTAELVYLLAPKSLQNDPEFCRLVLLGILGDTGTFNFIKPNQLRVFDIVKNILAVTKIEIQDFKAQYSLISPQGFEVIKEFIRNTHYQSIIGWPPFSYSYLSRDYLKNKQVEDVVISEASAIYVNQYLRVIDGYSWGIVIRPHHDGSCRLSFRSLPGSVNVRLLAEAFNGGGHNRASGGSVSPRKNKNLSHKQCLKIIFDWLSQNSANLD